MSETTPISGFSPEPGTPERIADGLDALASHLQQAAEKLCVLAAEVREVGESLKNWIEVAMRAGEKAAGEIDWSTTFHPPPATPEEMCHAGGIDATRLLEKLDSEQLRRRPGSRPKASR